MKKTTTTLIISFFISICSHLNAMEEGDSISNNFNSSNNIICRATPNKRKAEADSKLLGLLSDDLPKDLVDYLYYRKNEFHDYFPSLVLFVGEPGVGKSTIAKGIASKYEFQTQYIQCGLLANEYKNSGCQNIARVLKPIVNDTQPHLIIMDEIGVLSKKSSSKNETDRDMSEAFWALVDELHGSPHKIIATANDLKKMPEPLKSRFEEIFVITFPSKNTRKEIVKYLLSERKYTTDNNVMEYIVNNTNHYSLRNLESLVKKMIHSTGKRAQKKIILDPNNILREDVNFAFNRLKALSNLKNDKKTYKAIMQEELKKHWTLLPQIAISLYQHRNQMILGYENMQVSKDGVKTSKESLLVSKEGLDVSKEGLALNKEGIQIQKENLAFTKENTEIARKNLAIAQNGNSWHKWGAGSGVIGTTVNILRNAYDVPEVKSAIISTAVKVGIASCTIS